MPELTASIALGTAATLTALVLLLLRTGILSRRLFVTVISRWVAMGRFKSGLVLAMLGSIAIFSFASVPAAFVTSATNPPNAASSEKKSDEDVEALRSYANSIDPTRTPAPAHSAAPESSALPDVDTMVAKLVARLEKQPGDVKGWKVLAWSYQNLGKSGEAVTAYETALKLDPADPEIKTGLELAKGSKDGAAGASTAGAAIADGVTPAEGQQNIEMIRGMVERLATRLDSAPNDEDGWVRLMRSRVTLGDTEAARAALAKALAAFANDAVVKTRLTVAARELGVKSD